MKKYHLFYIIIGFILFSGCADVQQVAILENKVAALEAEHKKQLRSDYTIDNNIKVLEERLDKLASLEQYAEIKQDIKILKEKNQQLEGMIDELNHYFRHQGRSGPTNFEKKMELLENTASQNSLKILELEKYLGMKISGDITSNLRSEQKAISADKENHSSEDINPDQQGEQENALYVVAKKLFDDGDTTKARSQFENFLKKYPRSKLAGNARFWLAETFYAEKWYEKAILEYQKVLEDYPQNTKVPGARLKQGYCFSALGEKANARFILNELIKNYPDSSEAQIAKKKLESLE
jgi:tol-pal system protein YbgF